MVAHVQPITLTIALARLVELAEYELVSPACTPPPPGFHTGLKEAVVTTRQFLKEQRQPVGQFFLSADERPNQKQIGDNEKMRHQVIEQHKNQVITQAQRMRLVGILGEALLAEFAPEEQAKMVKELDNKDFNLQKHLSNKAKKPVVVTEDDSPWLKEMAKKLGYKTKDLPSESKRPLLSGNQAQLAESLHKEHTPDSLDMGRVRQVIKNKKEWGI